MGSNGYWSVEQCGWVAADADVHWSVQRCRWEPVGAVPEGLATPWSMFQAAPEVPQQRTGQAAPVEA